MPDDVTEDARGLSPMGQHCLFVTACVAGPESQQTLNKCNSLRHIEHSTPSGSSQVPPGVASSTEIPLITAPKLYALTSPL